MSLLDRLRRWIAGTSPRPRRGQRAPDVLPRGPAHAAVVWEGAAPHLVTRTERALERLETKAIHIRDAADLAAALREGTRWFVRAGAFDIAPPPQLAASATGLSLAAVGLPLPAPEPEIEGDPRGDIALAEEALTTTGGDLSDLLARGQPLPWVSLLLDEALADACMQAAEAATEGEEPAVQLAAARSSVGRSPKGSEQAGEVAEQAGGSGQSSGTHAERSGEGGAAALIASVLRSAFVPGAARARIVHVQAMDAPISRDVRVAELVTSLQIGGAERVARDLARGLGHVGISARLIALGRPTRQRWAPLPHELDLGETRLAPGPRVERLVAELDAWGADVVHAHLFGPDVLGALASARYAPVVTIHNAEPGWPPGTTALDAGTARLVLGCALEVERALRAAGVKAPLRAIHNGIEPERDGTPAAEALLAAQELRRSWGAGAKVSPSAGAAASNDAGVSTGASAVVVLVVANPRPPKRLERVPEIAERLAASTGEGVHVVWAGAASDTSETARAIESDLVGGLAARGIRTHALGAVLDLSAVYRACDVLLTTSAWEGLSLSHLEALAAGLPIVVTDVGGTREIAREAPDRVTLVAPDAPAEAFAEALARAARPANAARASNEARTFREASGGGDAVDPSPFSHAALARNGGPILLRASSDMPQPTPPSPLTGVGHAATDPRTPLSPMSDMPDPTPPPPFGHVEPPHAPRPSPAASPALPPMFHVRSMVRAHARILRRAARIEPGGGGAREGLVLVTNNFSPGGAQSSARRLLLALAERGIAVSAVTLQEHAHNPTPGTAALSTAGVQVLALPPQAPADFAAERIAEHVDARAAKAVVFWNTIAEHKALVADLLWDVRVFDVSPGEMYFRSLARYFERPRADSALRTARDYGGRLAGAIVKFEAERRLAEETLGCAVHVVPNGVPVRRRAAREREPGAPFRFGTTVRLHPDKRVEMLLGAFEQLHARGGGPWELLVLGGPDAGCEGYAAELARRAEGLPVRFLGFDDDVGPFLASLDAFVLVAEPAGCPNASLEAMGAGLAVIATDVGGIREQLAGGTGLVVPRTDERALAEAMERVGRDAELRDALARAGHERAERCFAVETMAERYAQVLGLTPQPDEAADRG
ncbi:MAG: glycosyltransferase [Polyangiaceae bacterium]